jgi:carboxylesterase
MRRATCVVVPRLPWHGLKVAVSNLAKMTADALRDVADASVNIASGLGDTVIVVGVSLGGNVAAWVAQCRPVYRSVIASPALGLSHLSTTLQTPTMNLMLRVPNYSASDPPDTLRPDRTLGWSTRGVGEMLKLGTAVRLRGHESRLERSEGNLRAVVPVFHRSTAKRSTSSSPTGRRKGGRSPTTGG